MSEQEVATELEYFMRKLGSERPAFTTIVASGVRGHYLMELLQIS